MASLSADEPCLPMLPQQASEPSPAQRRDEELCEHIARVHAESFGVYGARQGVAAVEPGRDRGGPLHRREADERPWIFKGFRRGTVKPTTIADHATARPHDLVQRRFAPTAPNRLWVADMTHVSTWSGWVYVAFVTDAYARMILGWRTSTSMTTQLVLDAVEHADLDPWPPLAVTRMAHCLRAWRIALWVALGRRRTGPRRRRAGCTMVRTPGLVSNGRVR